MKQCLLLFILIANWGCLPQNTDKLPEQFHKLKNLTVYSANEKPGKTISFKEEAVYGASKKILIGRMGDIAVDSSGRVFITDVQNQSIHIFQPDGQFITQLGKKGRGPSEFSNIRSLQIRQNRLYIYDPSQYKISIFILNSLTGDETIHLARNRGEHQALEGAYPWIHRIFVRNNSTYLAEFISNRSKPSQKKKNVEIKGLFYLLDSTGKIASNKLIGFKEETRILFKGLVVPLKDFFGNALTVLSSDNSIYWAGPDHFLIKVYSPSGSYRHAFYYPHKKISLTRESAIEAEVPDLFIRNMNSINLPEEWPILTDMKIDDLNRLWIAVTVGDMKVYEWWVLENNGKLLAKFTWPRKEPIEEIKNEYMYTRETDEATGLQQVVRYRIEMNSE